MTRKRKWHIEKSPCAIAGIKREYNTLICSALRFENEAIEMQCKQCAAWLYKIKTNAKIDLLHRTIRNKV